MKIKILILSLMLSIGLFTACTEKKKAKEKTKTEIKSEVNKARVENNIDKDEKRRLDSIRQVKEHGHAH
jgi:hypothetical protein